MERHFYMLLDNHETLFISAFSEAELMGIVEKHIREPGDPEYADEIARQAWEDGTAIYNVDRLEDDAPLFEVALSDNATTIVELYQKRIKDARDVVLEVQKLRGKIKSSGLTDSNTETLYREALRNLEEHENGYKRFQARRQRA